MNESAPQTCPIAVSHVTKMFRVRTKEQRLLGDAGRQEKYRRFAALDDVSFQVEQGEALGIIGMNGSGKSTLLKVLAGITPPTSGDMRIQGRVGSLIELGAGFHMELSGVENVYLNGTLLGIDRVEIDDRLPDIIEYSGLEEFMEMPVKHYSSGMQTRLGFAIAIQLHPDILLLDETMSTGDAAFQPKALESVMQFKKRGVTVLMVSHELPTVREHCDRVMWLDLGRIRMIGPPAEVVDSYRDFVFSSTDFTSVLVAAQHGDGLLAEPLAKDPPLTIESIEIHDQDGASPPLPSPREVAIRIAYRCTQPIENARLAVLLLNPRQAVIVDRDTERDKCPLGHLAQEGTVTLTLDTQGFFTNTFRVVAAFYDPQDDSHTWARKRADFELEGLPQPAPDQTLVTMSPCAGIEHRPLDSDPASA